MIRQSPGDIITFFDTEKVMKFFPHCREDCEITCQVFVVYGCTFFPFRLRAREQIQLEEEEKENRFWLVREWTNLRRQQRDEDLLTIRSCLEAQKRALEVRRTFLN